MSNGIVVEVTERPISVVATGPRAYRVEVASRPIEVSVRAGTGDRGPKGDKGDTGDLDGAVIDGGNF